MKTNSLPSRGWMQSAGRATHAADSPFSGGFARSAAGCGSSATGGAVKRSGLRAGLCGKHVPLRKRIGVEGIKQHLPAWSREEIRAADGIPSANRRDEKHMFRGEKPGLARPARRALLGCDPAQRKHVADQFTQAFFENAGHALALDRILEFWIERIDVHREPPFFPEIVEAVLIRRHRERGVHLQAARQCFEKPPRVLARITVIFAVLGDQARILPDGNSILAPIAGERPSR